MLTAQRREDREGEDVNKGGKQWTIGHREEKGQIKEQTEWGAL